MNLSTHSNSKLESETPSSIPNVEFATGECVLGMFLVARTSKGICSILLGKNAFGLEQELSQIFPQSQCLFSKKMNTELLSVEKLINHPNLPFELSLDIQGTLFQQRIWKVLQSIPSGQTCSYSDVAMKAGMPTASRAVAKACSSNKLALAIPCHRVIHKDGSFSGYRWGIERKKALLEKEQLLK